MKKLISLVVCLCVIGLVGCNKEAEARGYKGDVCDGPLGSIFNKCIDTSYEENKEDWDYGAYLHLIIFEGKENNWEIGLLNTYEHQREEFTSLVGAKIYLNRLFKKVNGE